MTTQHDPPPLVGPLEDLDADTRRRLERWMPRGTGVEPLALFRTLIRKPDLSEAMSSLGRHLLGKHCALSLAQRELLIARSCARANCEYEWGVHIAAFAEAAGLSPEQQLATQNGGADEACWNAEQRALVRLVDELHEGKRVSGETGEQLRRFFSEEQILEATVMVGWYHTISFVAHGLGTPLEPWAARFP